MALKRIPCPECKAGLKSPTGFTIGQTVCCPKCETYFVVEEPADENEEDEKPQKTKAATGKTAATTGKKPVKAAAMPLDDDDEDDDQPRKKKKKRQDDDDDQERSYKNSPLRYVVLGVLVVVMLVLGYFLYDKRTKENKETAGNDSTSPSDGPRMPPPPGGLGRPGEPGMPLPPGGPGGPFPKGPFPKGPNPKGPLPKGPTPVDPGVVAAQNEALLVKYKAALMGTWKADLGDGLTIELVYTPDGKVTETRKTPSGSRTISARWTATKLWGAASGPGSNDFLNRTGIVVTWTGDFGTTKPARLVFEDDELQHPIYGQPDVTGVFRKG